MYFLKVSSGYVYFYVLNPLITISQSAGEVERVSPTRHLDITMHNALRIRRDLVALEAFTIGDVSGLLKNLFPTIQAELTGFISKFSAGDEAVKFTTKERDFLKAMQGKTYMDIVSLTAHVPEGLAVTYLEYLDSLELAVRHATDITDGVLSPYSLFLAQLVSNAEERFSSGRIDQTYPNLAKERESFNKSLGQCFKPGSTKAEVKYGDVVNRNADWPQIFRRSEQLVTMVNKVDRKVLDRKVAECARLLDIVLEKVKREELNDANPQVVKNLAEGAYQVACELEFYSVTHYKAEAFAAAVSRTVQHCIEVFKD